MKLSTQIKHEDDETHPYGTAILSRNTLERWTRMAESTESCATRWRATAHIFAAVIVGLLIALMYAGLREPPVAAAQPANPSHVQAVWL